MPAVAVPSQFFFDVIACLRTLIGGAGSACEGSRRNPFSRFRNVRRWNLSPTFAARPSAM